MSILQSNRGFFLFVILFLIYVSNLSYIAHGDSVGNAFTASSLARDGDFYIDEFHDSRSEGGSGGQRRPPPYYATYTKKMKMVSIFGMGTPVVSSPFYFIKNFFKRGHSLSRFEAKMTGKVVAALFTALSALFLFFSLRLFWEEKLAWWVSLFYGLGTCVWSISSQALWQHGPTVCFISLALYFLSRGISGESKFIHWSALPLGLAVWCRPASAVYAIAFTVFVSQCHSKHWWRFVLTATPLALIYFLYQYLLFGNPFLNAEYVHSHMVAMEKTGSTGLWKFPIVGIPGLLLSPARGLLIYTPLLAFGLWGLKDCLFVSKTPLDKLLRYCGISFLLGLILMGSWFDWWGGWSFGYRGLVDSVPFLVFLGMPILVKLTQSSLWIKKWRPVVLVLAAWCLYVQFLGVFASDFARWHRYPVDVDTHHERLWSLTDNPILFYSKNFSFRHNMWRDGKYEW